MTVTKEIAEMRCQRSHPLQPTEPGFPPPPTRPNNAFFLSPYDEKQTQWDAMACDQ